MFAFVALGLEVPNEDIGWDERLQNDLFCFEWDTKPCLLSHVCAFDYYLRYRLSELLFSPALVLLAA